MRGSLRSFRAGAKLAASAVAAVYVADEYKRCMKRPHYQFGLTLDRAALKDGAVFTLIGGMTGVAGYLSGSRR